jgi:hypothetical protein
MPVRGSELYGFVIADGRWLADPSRGTGGAWTASFRDALFTSRPDVPVNRWTRGADVRAVKVSFWFVGEPFETGD